MPQVPPSETDAAVEAVAAAVEAAIEALDDELSALYLAAANGAPVADDAARLAALADRVAAAADDWITIATPPPAPAPDPAALLDEAGEALDGALALLDGLESDAALPPADRVRLAERARRAADTLRRAARTVALFSLDLDAHPAPADFRTPAARSLPPHPGVRDRITTTALDPDRAFVAWAVTAAGFARATEALLADERPTLTLRVYIESADQPPSVSDHPVDTWLGQTTMEIDDRPGALLVCAIGLAAGGTFAHIARAVAVQLPRATPGGGPVRFARATPDADGRLRVEAAPPPPAPRSVPPLEPGAPIATLLAPVEVDR